ncbi:helix-turn-helix transcriptional regulator [Thioclava sp. BHET1]|nr:helix-turn-helix transcriptional regulator [Thioclava sp. BHET1]
MLCILPVMNRLAEYLTKQGETQKAFAAKLGSTQGFVSKLCRGGARPSLDTASKISRLTDGHVPVSVWLSPSPRSDS